MPGPPRNSYFRFIFFSFFLSEYKEDTSIVTKNASVVVKRVPAPKTGGLLAKIKALDAAAALQSTATYDIFPFDELSLACVKLDDMRLFVGDVVFRPSLILFVIDSFFSFFYEWLFFLQPEKMVATLLFVA